MKRPHLISWMSLRTQLLVFSLALVLLATGVTGWLAFHHARDAIVREATRAVGIAANAREQALLRLIQQHRERGATFLRVARAGCLERVTAPGSCLQGLLDDFVETEGAMAARLVTGAGVISAGEGHDGLEKAVIGPVPAAYFEPGVNGKRTYRVSVQDAELHLTLRFPVEPIQPVFADRIGLGESGETFLVDPGGFFITPGRYPSASGHSHPIDATPMKACLSGQDFEAIAPDYRGVEVIHGFRHVAEIGGGCIMAHIEAAEAFAPVARLARNVRLASLVLRPWHRCWRSCSPGF